MIILIAEILMVIASSWILTKKYFCIERYSDSILVSSLLFFAQIILVTTFLGIIGKLYLVNVFIAHFLILSVVLLFFLRKTIPFPTKPDLKPFADSKLLLFAVSIFVSFGLVSVYKNLINPPLDADSLIYHLVFPASWIKSGTIDNPFFIFASKPTLYPGSPIDGFPSYYPINGELFFAWLVLPLRNAFLADLGEVPFYVVGIIAFYSILSKYNVNGKIALLSGFLWALIPNVFKQIKVANNLDVICATFFLLVIFTLLLLKSNFTLKNSVLFGSSAGIFVGIKFNNFVYLLALFPFIFYVFYHQVKIRKISFAKILQFLIVVILAMGIFGGYMYAKNYLFTGNPIFPVEFKLFGKTIFKGLIDKNSLKLQVFGKDALNFFRIFREGLGIQFFTLILPFTFLPLFFCGHLKKRVPFPGGYQLLLLTPLMALILFKIFIDVYIVRYFFPYLCLGLLTSVLFLTSFRHGGKYFYAVFFTSILYAIFQLAHRYELIVSFFLFAACFVFLLRYKTQLFDFYENRNFIKFILTVFIMVCTFLIYSNNKYNNEEYDRYISSLSKNEKWQVDLRKGWKALNEVTGKGARVAYTGRQEAYPLYGSALKNDVKYVSVNEKEITPYNNPDGRYRQTKDFSAWRRNLKKNKIEYLFIAKPVFENRESPDPDKFPIEDEWASMHPEDFRLVFNNSLSRIYKILISYD